MQHYLLHKEYLVSNSYYNVSQCQLQVWQHKSVSVQTHYLLIHHQHVTGTYKSSGKMTNYWKNMEESNPATTNVVTVSTATRNQCFVVYDISQIPTLPQEELPKAWRLEGLYDRGSASRKHLHTQIFHVGAKSKNNDCLGILRTAVCDVRMTVFWGQPPIYCVQ